MLLLLLSFMNRILYDRKRYDNTDTLMSRFHHVSTHVLLSEDPRNHGEVRHSQTSTKTGLKLRNENYPGWWGYIGDELPPSYIGIIISHCKDPYQTSSISWKVLYPAGFFSMAHLAVDIYTGVENHQAFPLTLKPVDVHPMDPWNKNHISPGKSSISKCVPKLWENVYECATLLRSQDSNISTRIHVWFTHIWLIFIVNVRNIPYMDPLWVCNLSNCWFWIKITWNHHPFNSNGPNKNSVASNMPMNVGTHLFWLVMSLWVFWLNPQITSKILRQILTSESYK